MLVGVNWSGRRATATIGSVGVSRAVEALIADPDLSPSRSSQGPSK
jgi:hypothetical protein